MHYVRVFIPSILAYTCPYTLCDTYPPGSQEEASTNDTVISFFFLHHIYIRLNFAYTLDSVWVAVIARGIQNPIQTLQSIFHVRCQ